MIQRVRGAKRMWGDESASQMVEFAVSLPLLIVMVVGIFDFSGAYTLKQKLGNAARNGARAAAADPVTDLANGGLSCTTLNSCPASVSDAYQVVDNYLNAAKVNDCGITPGSATSPVALAWSFTANSAGPPPCKITLTINRGWIVNNANSDCTKQPAAGGAPYLIGTCVQISYAYNWHFNTVVTLLVPGAAYSGQTMLTSSSVAFNEN